MKIRSILSIIGLAVIATAANSTFAAASGKNTAAHVKAFAPELEGEKVSLDVVLVRFHRHAPEDSPYTYFWAMTIDEDARSGGGGILVVADAEDREKIIRQYGTNIDRDGRDGPDYKSMRGVVRIVDREKGRRAVYLDLTDAGVDLSNAPSELLDDEGTEIADGIAPGGKSRPGPGRMGK